MSCNGCRVLRKGCSEECMLRHCLQGIESPQAQAHATVFVAKFFGRAALMSFISSVPTHQRSALFRSLLYEAVGRTINPVNGAVGLLWTGNWHLCQLGVEKVLRGGSLSPLSDFSAQSPVAAAEDDKFGSALDCSSQQDDKDAGSRNLKRKVRCDDVILDNFQARDDRFKCCLGLGRPDSPAKVVVGGSSGGGGGSSVEDNRRAATPSEESETTTLGSSAGQFQGGSTERKLLRLFF